MGLAALLSSLLVESGHSCETVNSGRQALERLDANEYDLALLDDMLPDMSASELVAAARGRGRMPLFLVLTSHGDGRVAVELMKLGARDYLIMDTTLLHRLPGMITRLLENSPSSVSWKKT